MAQSFPVPGVTPPNWGQQLIDSIVDLIGVVNVKSKGAIADGASHPLSERYDTLEEAQTVYPFATDLSQEIDYCACKAASNEAFGGDLEVLISYVVVSEGSDDMHIVDSTQNWTVNEHAGKTAFRKFTSNGFVTSVPIASNTSDTLVLAAAMPFGDIGDTNEYAIGYGEHGDNAILNKPLRIPSGSYRFGDDTWTIRNLVSGKIYGDGRRATIIRGNKTLLAFDGLWYSTLRDFSLELTADDGVAALEIDGNIPTQDYATRGVQGNSLEDLLIDAGGSLYSFAMTRQGGSGGQGSENIYKNVHLSGASFACYRQDGFNALANTFLGGNFQSYPKHGAYIVGGTVGFLNTGFQSTYGYRQIENGGYDIMCGESGAYEGCFAYGCRTESPQFLNNVGSVRVDVRSCVGNVAFPTWSQHTSFGALAAQYKAILSGGRLFVATTEGTTGDDPGPDFDSVASGGTIADGTVVWTETAFTSIINKLGSVDLKTVSMRGGGLYQIPPRDNLIFINVDHVLNPGEDIIIIDCTNNNVTLTLTGDDGIDRGHTVEIERCDESANVCTIASIPGFQGGGSTRTLGGSARAYKKYVFTDGVSGVRSWHEIGSSA